jgi:predicted AAA+ superfamily ATPase
LESRLRGNKTIFIDEIQRLPRLTNTIQALLDQKKQLRFFLTGSSARKLRREHANLLPGRIFSYQLGPLNFKEIGKNIDMQSALSTGLLPGIYTDADANSRREQAIQYAGIYLKEEIAAEGLARNIEGFARFLSFAAVSAGDILDLSKISTKAQIPRATATRFFELLEDTLLVRRCPAFSQSDRRRLIQHPRFYFFDTGVANGLLKNFAVSEDRKGRLFEAFVFNQIYDYLTALNIDFRLSFYRTEHGAEIDFILEYKKEIYAIEVKASTNVGLGDLKGFDSFAEFYKKKFHKIVLYMGKQPKCIAGVDIFPWDQGLDIIFGA